jgi:hypothetical protein
VLDEDLTGDCGDETGESGDTMVFATGTCFSFFWYSGVGGPLPPGLGAVTVWLLRDIVELLF